MRAITIKQPWAYAIVHLGKDVENRDWAPNNLSGRIAIHAGKTQDEGGYPAIRSILSLDVEGIWRVAEAAVCGAIIGTIRVVDCHHTSFTPGGLCEYFGCAPWGMAGSGCHWVLADPRPCEPIPCRGALGLWTVPDDIAARIGG